MTAPRRSVRLNTSKATRLLDANPQSVEEFHIDGNYVPEEEDSYDTFGAFKVAVHRLRKKFRHVVTEQIAQTVGDSAEVQDELNSLVAALSHSAI